MTGAKILWRPHIEDDRALRGQRANFRRRQWREAWQFSKGAGAGAINFGVRGKISRRLRQVVRHHLDEFIFSHGLERVIELALIANRGKVLFRQITAAHRAGAVRGIDFD